MLRPQALGSPVLGESAFRRATLEVRGSSVLGATALEQQLVTNSHHFRSTPEACLGTAPPPVAKALLGPQ